ncbi:hypothetical protein [Turicibacter sp. TS3]|uniref:hypothetical protein n=1 Tax=Turicibacter sp. TS3 TaxID=2304578 RepID=UPI00137A6A5E|nr:hypothetical protein [Turicibacter sp. TS3]NCE78320.1 hypothetical protein [Turicibacter sp. TS3]
MQGRDSFICKRAVEVFGKDTQVLMYFEEAGELAQAISKYKRGFGKKSDIAEEIADVEIMIEQLKHIYKCHYPVEIVKQQKLMRLSARVEGKKETMGKQKKTCCTRSLNKYERSN